MERQLNVGHRGALRGKMAPIRGKVSAINPKPASLVSLSGLLFVDGGKGVTEVEVISLFNVLFNNV